VVGEAQKQQITSEPNNNNNNSNNNNNNKSLKRWSLLYKTKHEITNMQSSFNVVTISGYKEAERIEKCAYGMEDRGFESLQGPGSFLFASASRLALGPTQPIQWVPGALCWG
jgi:hypothetical protein